VRKIEKVSIRPFFTRNIFAHNIAIKSKKDNEKKHNFEPHVSMKESQKKIIIILTIYNYIIRQILRRRVPRTNCFRLHWITFWIKTFFNNRVRQFVVHQHLPLNSIFDSSKLSYERLLHTPHPLPLKNVNRVLYCMSKLIFICTANK